MKNKIPFAVNIRYILTNILLKLYLRYKGISEEELTNHIKKSLESFTENIEPGFSNVGWICMVCGTKYGNPPYLLHSSFGCNNCVNKPEEVKKNINDRIKGINKISETG